MTSTTRAFDRPLGYGELFWWKISEAASTNFVMVAEVGGAIDEARLRAALGRVARRHPMLRARVDARPRRPVFRFGGEARVPLQVLARASEHHFVRVVEDELNRSVPHDAAPMWRATLLRGEDTSELILTFHHAISDARSAATVVRDALTEYAGLAGLADLEPPPAYDDLLDGPSALRTLASGASSVAARVSRGPISEIPPRPDVAPEPGADRTRFLDLSLDESTTWRVVTRCREHGLTVHGLLSGVLLLAAYDAMDGGPSKTVSLTSAVDVRPLLQGDRRDDVGYFVTGVESRFLVSPDASPFTLGYLAGARTRRQLTREGVAANLLLRRLVLALKRSGHELVAAAPRSSQASIHLTNLGRLDLEAAYGDVTLRRCFHVPSVHVAQKPFVCLAAVSFRGALQLTFSYSEPRTDRATVRAIAERYLRHLHAIADGDAQDADEDDLFNF